MSPREPETFEFVLFDKTAVNSKLFTSFHESKLFV